jgi:hypothetical protein
MRWILEISTLVHGAKLFGEASASVPERRGLHPEVSHAHIGGIDNIKK